MSSSADQYNPENAAGARKRRLDSPDDITDLRRRVKQLEKTVTELSDKNQKLARKNKELDEKVQKVFDAIEPSIRTMSKAAETMVASERKFASIRRICNSD